MSLPLHATVNQVPSLSLTCVDNWQPQQYPFVRDQFGVWRGKIPPLPDGSPAIKNGQALRVSVGRARHAS